MEQKPVWKYFSGSEEAEEALKQREIEFDRDHDLESKIRLHEALFMRMLLLLSVNIGIRKWH